MYNLEFSLQQSKLCMLFREMRSFLYFVHNETLGIKHKIIIVYLGISIQQSNPIKIKLSSQLSTSPLSRLSVIRSSDLQATTGH